ncbi:MAG: hypothetical protein KKD69_06410, partial [Euryarchaeota archaeon]|nr:hypothetical protein [Euryarchaeota archaeon]
MKLPTAHHQARDFYMDKLSRLDEMSSHKREFMIAVINLIANNSYLAEQMKGVGNKSGEILA